MIFFFFFLSACFYHLGFFFRLALLYVTYATKRKTSNFVLLEATSLYPIALDSFDANLRKKNMIIYRGPKWNLEHAVPDTIHSEKPLLLKDYEAGRDCTWWAEIKWRSFLSKCVCSDCSPPLMSHGVQLGIQLECWELAAALEQWGASEFPEVAYISVLHS